MLNIKQFYSPKEIKHLTHAIHPYPGQFIPQVVHELIKEYSFENDVIFDPFCGSGTVLLEANLLKRNVIGMDVHPLACLISRGKAMIVDKVELQHETNKIVKEVRNQLRRKKTLFDFIDVLHPAIPPFPKREKWFQSNILKELAVLKEEISNVEKIEIKNVFLVAFSSVVKDVSNASSLYKLTFHKKKNFSRLYVPYVFLQKMNKVIRMLNDYKIKASMEHFIKVNEYDARVPFPIEKIDFIITNLPAFNLDFIRSFKIHYWWLYGGNGVMEYLKMLDGKRIGTRKIRDKVNSLKSLYRLPQNLQKGTSEALQQYFDDLYAVFRNCYNALKDEKFCCLQVYDFVVEGYTILVIENVLRAAKLAGFIVERRIQRVISKKVILFAKEDRVEEILVLRK
jgi:site-specific DNA-methyltransferase (cytosine-N4-specific)